MRHTPLFRLLLIVTFGGVFISGATWFGLDAWGWREGEFGMEPHPAVAPSRVLHGILAAGALVLFGMLLARHVPEGWIDGKNRISGALLCATLALLAISGCALYYAGDETTRGMARIAHLVAGFAFPLAVGAHIAAALRLRRRPSEVRMGE